MAATMQTLSDNLRELERRFTELDHLMADPGLATDTDRLIALGRERAELDEIVTAWREFRANEEQIDEARLMAEDSDPDMAQLAQDELKALRKRQSSLEDNIARLLVPKDPNDEKDVIVEVRAGTGGDEAALFAADLFRMYTRYAERRRWKVDVMSATDTDGGGFREVIFEVKGDGAYSHLRYESGVHRVQRVPATESGGRIHTSAATVAVLPEAEGVDIDIPASDIRIDTMRASGTGGQHVNTTDSAVRITHLPTGIVVTSSEKSQHANRARAMQVLRARLFALERQRLADARAADRKGQVGSGDRSERIRTYNFPQGRLTDHRIGLTLYRLDQVMQGDLDEVIAALAADDQARRLADLEA